MKSRDFLEFMTIFRNLPLRFCTEPRYNKNNIAMRQLDVIDAEMMKRTPKGDWACVIRKEIDFTRRYRQYCRL